MAVIFAKKHNLGVTIKSTGSDLWGKSSAHTCSSMCMNLMVMKQIIINPDATMRSEHGEVTVQTGVSSWSLYKEVTVNMSVTIMTSLD